MNSLIKVMQIASGPNLRGREKVQLFPLSIIFHPMGNLEWYLDLGHTFFTKLG